LYINIFFLNIDAWEQPKTKQKNYTDQTKQNQKTKKYYIVHMKSAKGEPMNGNMPAVRLKTKSAKGEPMNGNMPAVR
jgi:hypothetical protein